MQADKGKLLTLTGGESAKRGARLKTDNYGKQTYPQSAHQA